MRARPIRFCRLRGGTGTLWSLHLVRRSGWQLPSLNDVLSGETPRSASRPVRCLFSRSPAARSSSAIKVCEEKMAIGGHMFFPAAAHVGSAQQDGWPLICKRRAAHNENRAIPSLLSLQRRKIKSGRGYVLVCSHGSPQAIPVSWSLSMPTSTCQSLNLTACRPSSFLVQSC